jgi:formate dehydrogenase subunit delta
MSESSPVQHGSAEHLVAMANDIGNYFRAQGREEAITGIATHLRRYWTRRMLAKLNAFVVQGAPELDELPRAALMRINDPG